MIDGVWLDEAPKVQQADPADPDMFHAVCVDCYPDWRETPWTIMKTLCGFYVVPAEYQEGPEGLPVCVVCWHDPVQCPDCGLIMTNLYP